MILFIFCKEIDAKFLPANPTGLLLFKVIAYLSIVVKLQLILALELAFDVPQVHLLKLSVSLSNDPSFIFFFKFKIITISF